MKAARGEGELGVDVEGGGGEAAEGGGELSGEEELEAELGLAGGALGDELGDGVTGNAAGEAAIENGAAESALLGGESEGVSKKVLWNHSLLTFFFFLEFCKTFEGRNGAKIVKLFFLSPILGVQYFNRF